MLCTGLSLAATRGQEQGSSNPAPAHTTIELIEAERLDTIALDQAAYFVGSDGRPAVVEAGAYEIEVVEPGRLRLVHRKSKGTVTIRATSTRHGDSLSTPIALSVSGSENTVHVVLLLPGGKALDAAGSYEVIRSRTTTPPVLSAEQLHEALQQKLTEIDRLRSGPKPQAGPIEPLPEQKEGGY